MPLLFLDVETRSAADIDLGGEHYARDPSTEMLCVCFAVDDGPVESWTPGSPIPAPFIAAANDPATVFVAHNAAFEIAIFEHVLAPRHGFPPIPIERWRCTAALARFHGFPGALEKVAELLRLPHQKDVEGKKLMLRLARPRRPLPGEDPADVYFHEPTPEEMARLVKYCARDVEATRAASRALPALPEAEQALWALNQRINARGFRVDIEFAEGVLRLARAALEHIDGELSEVTDGAITKCTQVKRMRAFVDDRGAAT